MVYTRQTSPAVLHGIVWLLLLAAPLDASELKLEEYKVNVQIVDADDGAALPARLYLTGSDGASYYFESSDEAGTAVKYEKQNQANKNSVEYHTTVSAHPCYARVPAGKYDLSAAHGKAYHTWSQPVEVNDHDVAIRIELKRWCNPAARGWYSGDTHLHRTLDELRNVILAEDLNVALPLTSWVTLSGTPPVSGNKNIEDVRFSSLISVDEQHVIWPRNTEYEIFSVGKQRHTLGALFVLGHQRLLQTTVPPWKVVIDDARENEPQALFDMDKLDWPFAMLLPTLAPHALYELANNHVWRTQFGFRNWNSPTPPYLQPPFGAANGGHREWLDYTHGMYYSLLNCGLRLPPSAGTANGVHPVPAGFGRVYVHVPEGFSYEAWMRGLGQGRSFVTTGPMLYATADGHDPGHEFQFAGSSTASIAVEVEVQSERPLLYGEIVINGRPEHLLNVKQVVAESGVYRAQLERTIQPTRSGWFAIRFWESAPDGQVRFAHSAPWYVDIDSQPVQISRTEKRYVVERVQREMARSQAVVTPEAMHEYRTALQFYESLPELDDRPQVARVARPARSDDELNLWLDNMIIDHRFDADEVRLATGMPFAVAEREVAIRASRSAVSSSDAVRLLPYPGGRHPRRGFLDGAVDPQRESKVSVFPPWKDGGYVVIDVPEAIFSNLGLTYLAHTHIPTIWDQQSTPLPRLEWSEIENGLSIRRELPNGIAFHTTVTKAPQGVDMRIDLTNGTPATLTGLRVQVCTMLKGAQGFQLQEPLESLVDGAVVAVRGAGTERWIVTAWEPNQRVWQNPPVPCIHSDPAFPDCKAGDTVSVTGILRFYEGPDLRSALASLVHTRD